MESMNVNWETNRPSIFHAMLCRQAGLANPCCKCGGNDAKIRCHQCHAVGMLCGVCDENQHQHAPFHDREYLEVDGTFSAILPTQGIGSDGCLVDISMLIIME